VAGYREQRKQIEAEHRQAHAVLTAKIRAYKVAWVLRDPDLAEGCRLRPAWGWIAVSGEDDSPARPVNVSSGIPIYGPDGTTQISAHPQYELTRPCQLSQYPRPPKELLDNPDSAAMMIQPANRGGFFTDGGSPSKYGLRLNQALRDVAAQCNPAVAMGNAAARYYRGDPTWGAFADVAVTGRAAYESLRNHQPTDDEIKDVAHRLLMATSVSEPEPIKLAVPQIRAIDGPRPMN